MRLSDLFENMGRALDPEEAAMMIAEDDELFNAVAEYVVQYESGIAEHPHLMDRFVAILSRVTKTKRLLFRGECRSGWQDKFGRGFHSWSANLRTANYFKNECYTRRGYILVIDQAPVRAISLSDIITMRMRCRPGESHYGGYQAEVFVYDPDAVSAAMEPDVWELQTLIKKYGIHP